MNNGERIEMRFDDTIFALASAPGKAAVSVVKISGRASKEAIKILSGAPLPSSREVVVRWLFNPKTGQKIDRAIVFWFSGPRSYTGEDVTEFHIHGGPAVSNALLQILGNISGLRPAEAGEFTRRAFENGKLDLTVAEGIADLVDAETDVQRQQALRQSSGDLSALYDGWRVRLIESRSLIEASIDFSDQELPNDVLDSVPLEVRSIADEISHHLKDGGRGQRLREGIKVTILGPPNAGKSSLINMLSRTEVAIVSPAAGTTRDIIEVHINLDGWPLSIGDTAGLRTAASDLEAEGIRRAVDRADNSDIIILMFDGEFWPNIPRDMKDLVDQKCILVLNKCDLARVANSKPMVGDRQLISVSCKTGEGVKQLKNALKTFLETCYNPSAAPSLTRARHRYSLEICLEALKEFDLAKGYEIAAEDIRVATNALGKITGKIDVESLLDKIFNDFCIGK